MGPIWARACVSDSEHSTGHGFPPESTMAVSPWTPFAYCQELTLAYQRGTGHHSSDTQRPLRAVRS
jgi:hypothetical protein